MEKINQLFKDWQNTNKKRMKAKLHDQLLRVIWQTYHPKLQVFLSSCPSADRQDRVSDVLLQVFESLENYNPQYAFSTWIYRIARNNQIDRLRKKTPHLVEWDHDELIGNDETPESITMEETDRILIKDAIETLKPADHEILFLAFYEEMKYREISEVTGIPEGTIKYRIHRIKSELKEKLKEDLSYGTEDY